ncbi:YopX family protein [Enterococcus faecium]|nr:YopX family protein [Enterococcus faecium]
MIQLAGIQTGKIYFSGESKSEASQRSDRMNLTKQEKRICRQIMLQIIGDRDMDELSQQESRMVRKISKLIIYRDTERFLTVLGNVYENPELLEVE